MEYELLSDAEMNALPRKVGRMTYEQAYRLMQEMKRLQEEHEALLVYPTPRKGYHHHDSVPPSTFKGCPYCKETQPWPEIDAPCAEMRAIQQAIDACVARNVLHSEGAVYLDRRAKHKARCLECTYEDAYYDGRSSCAYAGQLHMRWRIYVKRVSDLERKWDIQRWEQVHGRSYDLRRDWPALSDWLNDGNTINYREQFSRAAGRRIEPGDIMEA